MGLDVASDQRLTTARELRHNEEQHALALDEMSAEAQASTPAARQRRLRVLAGVMPWVPTKKPRVRPISGPATSKTASIAGRSRR